MYLVETVGHAIPCFRHGTDYVLNLYYTGPSAYYAKVYLPLFITGRFSHPSTTSCTGSL